VPPIKKKHVVLAVTNDLSTDQRIHKMATTLMELGYSVELVGRKLKHSVAIERNYLTKRFRLWFTKGKLFYIEFNLRLFWYLLFKKFDIIHANDLDTLIACYFIAKWRKKAIVYDSHEYFTEVPELLHRPFTRSIWLFLEKICFPNINAISTVTASIANCYEQLYKRPVLVIKNMPFRRKDNVVIQKAISERRKILIYQGAVNLGRGLEWMVESMQFLPEYTLWIIGSGDILNQIKNLVIKKSLSDRVIFYGQLPFEMLVNYTKQALLGFCLADPESLSVRYSLSNKLFDYIQQSVPVLGSDIPEFRNIICGYGVGAVYNGKNPEELALAVRWMLTDNVNYQRMCQNAAQAAVELCWENQKPIIEELYKRAIPPTKPQKQL
jgi:glycosyltransferase involved in cell wall biosynthesis